MTLRRVRPWRAPKASESGLLLGLVGVALGCTGYLESDAQPGGATTPFTSAGASGAAPGGSSSAASECADSTVANVAEARIRRLNRMQYDNTLRDLGLIGASDSVAVAGFTGDSTVGGRKHGYTIGGSVDPVLARDLLDAAMSVASSPAAAKLVGCTPTSAAEEDACTRSFITTFGRRAFRRALSEPEQTELFGVFSAVRAQLDFQAGVAAVTAALLSAPEFLYLVESEPGAAGAVVPVDGRGLASRLSYFLWDSMPDEPLLAAAESGQLATADGVRQAAERLLADESAHHTVNRFLREWTGIERLSDAQKQGADEAGMNAWYTPELVADLQASFLGSLESTFFASEPMLHELLGSSSMLINDRIASAYGLAMVGAGEALVERPVPGERLGFLTHPAFMALQAKPTRGDPIHRGLFVREQLLCNELPDPPVTDKDGNPIVFNVGATGPGISNRQRFKEHTASAECAACHTLIDPLGFGFENYDALGRFRTTDENGITIDASGDVLGDNDATGPFNGGSELVARLSRSKTVAACMTVQWFRYALSRDEASEDACALASVQARFSETGGNLKEMLIALTASDAFRFRKVGAK